MVKPAHTLTRIITNFIFPLITTAFLWVYLDRVVQILAILVLTTIWLSKLGFNVNVADRIRKTRIWKLISMVLRSSTPILKINEEYLDETGQILADGTKKIYKKIEEEVLVKSKGNLREKIKWTLLGNKKMITTYVIIGLLSVDQLFGFSKRFNLPPDIWYYIGPALIALIVWAVGGEGFTSWLTNKERFNVKAQKSSVRKEVADWNYKIQELENKIKSIAIINGVVPPHLKPDYDRLTASLVLYKAELAKLEATVNK